MVEEKTCRICLDEEDGEALISPCACTGTSKYVHASCLIKYRRMFPRMDVRRVRCGVCKEDYKVEVHGFSIEAFQHADVPPIIVRERRDHQEDGTSPMVYLIAHFMLLMMNGFWAGFCLATPGVAKCIVPCFWGWLFFGMHMLNVFLYFFWYKSCTVLLLGVPAGLMLAREGNIIVYSTVAFNAVQLLSAILASRVDVDY